MAHKLLQDENGVLYIAKEVEQVAADEAQRLYEHLKSDIALVEKFLGITPDAQPSPSLPADQGADQPQNTAADPNIQADGPSQTVAAPPAPADPNQPPAGDPNAQPAPVDQAAPADPNATAAPALDANGNPVQATSQDPNQVQPQPEQRVMPPLQ